jgi:hypothetical protein
VLDDRAAFTLGLRGLIGEQVWSMDDRFALTTNQAGIRLIALLTVYNRQDFQRLERLIADSYAAELLDDEAADDRLRAVETLYADVGRLRIRQVLALEKYRVVVLAQAERDHGLHVHEIQVDPEYPHKITAYKQYALA